MVLCVLTVLSTSQQNNNQIYAAHTNALNYLTTVMICHPFSPFFFVHGFFMCLKSWRQLLIFFMNCLLSCHRCYDGCFRLIRIRCLLFLNWTLGYHSQGDDYCCQTIHSFPSFRLGTAVEIVCGGCLCSATTPDRSLKQRWLTWTTSAVEAAWGEHVLQPPSSGSGGHPEAIQRSFVFILLQEFVEHDKWMHIDIAGVMTNKKEVAYLGAGMSGDNLNFS